MPRTRFRERFIGIIANNVVLDSLHYMVRVPQLDFKGIGNCFGLHIKAGVHMDPYKGYRSIM